MNEQLFDAMLRTALEEALEEDCREAPAEQKHTGHTSLRQRRRMRRMLADPWGYERRSRAAKQMEAQQKMQEYVSAYPDFPLPARYAHPVVLRRMKRAVMDGRAVTAGQALDVVKDDLRALNADVEVSQEEYDEVVAIKPLFLNAEYQ